MQEYSKEQANVLADENNSLRLRLLRLQELQNGNESNGCDSKIDENTTNCDCNDFNTSRVERINERNHALREEIEGLTEQLAELKHTNITELYHEFLRLDQRRGELLSENRSLHNILLNQQKYVELAANKVHEHDELRRQNEEYNSETKADTITFRERRNQVFKEVKRLLKREAQLQSELESIPTSQENYAAEVNKLNSVIAEKNQQIAELSNAAEGANKKVDDDNCKASKNNSVDKQEIIHLRQQYVELKEKIKKAEEHQENILAQEQKIEINFQN